MSDIALYSIRSGILSQWIFSENRSDVVVFWGFSNLTDESIRNSLEAVYLGDVLKVPMQYCSNRLRRCSDA